jgi:hypothetical protein
MTELIYKFLDNYFGDEVTVRKMKYMMRPEYVISSPKGGPILSFIVHDIDPVLGETITLIGRNSVARMLCGFFPLSEKDAMSHIRDWFGDKHNLKKVGDVLKFIPQDERNHISISQ